MPTRHQMPRKKRRAIQRQKDIVAETTRRKKKAKRMAKIEAKQAA